MGGAKDAEKLSKEYNEKMKMQVEEQETPKLVTKP